MGTKERPIIFSGEMVRAILDGRKTQTRRVVKFRDLPDQPEHHNVWRAPSGWHDGDEPITCRYGAPGDLLWVRETIALVSNWTVPTHGGATIEDRAASVYVADRTLTPADAWPWKNPVLPSIFMPRGLARIMLRVTDVRVERLDDISLGDIAAEGWPDAPQSDVAWLSEQPQLASNGFGWFRELWNSINGKKHPWEANPWVWVVTFARVEP